MGGQNQWFYCPICMMHDGVRSSNYGTFTHIRFAWIRQQGIMDSIVASKLFERFLMEANTRSFSTFNLVSSSTIAATFWALTSRSWDKLSLFKVLGLPSSLEWSTSMMVASWSSSTTSVSMLIPRDFVPAEIIAKTSFFENSHSLHYVCPYAVLFPCFALGLQKEPSSLWTPFFQQE